MKIMIQICKECGYQEEVKIYSREDARKSNLKCVFGGGSSITPAISNVRMSPLRKVTTKFFPKGSSSPKYFWAILCVMTIVLGFFSAVCGFPLRNGNLKMLKILESAKKNRPS